MDHLRVRVDDASQVAQARREAVALARSLGFGETRAGTVALAVTEAATNLVKHAKAGQILLGRVPASPDAGIEVYALDRGPGIADLAASLRDGHSTAGTPGLGLGSLSRLAANFEVYSQPGKGTVLHFEIWRDRDPPPRRGAQDRLGSLAGGAGGDHRCDVSRSEEHPRRIFEEFSQIEHRLQSKVKGTGLGLPLCRRLATLLGGAIAVTSEPGVGSTFTATLPAQYEPLRFEPQPEARPLDPRKTPVLVVEDDPGTRLFYEKILRDTPYQALTAAGLREARDWMARVRPGAIVLDILLRGENGWELLTAIENDAATRGIPVIVASSVEDERKAYALGADCYLDKPVERDALLTALARCTAPRVLVIDDDPASRYAIKKILGVAQYGVVEAVDGSSGFDLACRVRPQIIVLDLGLPDVKGEEVLRRLAHEERTRGIPVVVATSRDLSEPERELLQARAVAILSKRDLNADMLPAIASALVRRAGAMP